MISGIALVPMKGKRPLVPWRWLVDTPNTTIPTLKHPDADGFGVVTGPGSGLMVLDFDSPPYLSSEYNYTATPSGGRHYFFHYHDGDRHGLNVPNELGAKIDIPYVVRLYASPVVNNTRIPIQPPPTITSPGARQAWTDPPERPDMQDIAGCAFISWFRRAREDSSWDGRYPLARAYASNVLRVDHPDLSLGNGYRHTEDIYNRPPERPITCNTIANTGFRCPHMDDYGECTLTRAFSPYGFGLKKLAARVNKL